MAGLLKASGDGWAEALPFGDEGVIRLEGGGAVVGVDDAVVIPSQFPLSVHWAVVEEVAPLVDGASLDLDSRPSADGLCQSAVPVGHHDYRGWQATSTEILDQVAPTGRGLARCQSEGYDPAHTVLANALYNQDRGTDHASG
jgi:hypothetical protein